YLDENGKPQSMIMGCYGIGVSRTIAAVIEQFSDENGIVWPMSVAPYQVLVVPVSMREPEQVELAEKIYEELRKKGVDVLLDDRAERVGVKFKDADLIGIPVRITVGKKAVENVVEYKLRANDEVLELSANDAMEKALACISETINGNKKA
ncbi:MAG: proline--tRNA ligase, partial [Clostridia bacterium]|nr:proline--tRNA ligase [Clostridia bacterium]